MWAICALFPQWFSALGEPIVVPAGDQVKLADAWTMSFYLSTGVICGTVASLFTRRPSLDKLLNPA